MTAKAKSVESNKDIFLKLRMRKILFAEGYWTPLEVDLSQYEPEPRGGIRRRSLTDLDVLGVKYDRLLAPDIVVVDCKSGKVSDANRLFWLKGVRDYFGATQAYLVRPQVDMHARAIAPKLGLRVLSEAELGDIEKALSVRFIGVPIDDIDIQDKIEYMWASFNIRIEQSTSGEDRILKRIKSYLDYSFWYMENPKNLLRIVDEFSSISFFLDEKNERHKLIAYMGLERFVYSALSVASTIQSQGLSDIPRFSRLIIHGGTAEIRSKERVFELLRRVGIQENLDPEWFEEGVEFMGRLIRNPDGSSDVLRYIQAAYISRIVAGQESMEIVKGQPLSVSALSMARDAAITFSRITGIKRALYEQILDM